MKRAIGWIGSLGLLLAASAAAGDDMFLAFTPDPARAGAPSPEGCATEPGVARGFLASSTEGTCHSGLVGSYSAAADTAAIFETGALSTATRIGGPGTMVVYWTAPATGDPFVAGRVSFLWREKHASGSFTTITAGSFWGEVLDPAGNADIQREEVAVEVPAYTLSPGGRLQVVLYASPTTPSSHEARVLFGGEFSDAGITFDAPGWTDPGTGGSDPTPDPIPPDPVSEPAPEPEPEASSGSGGGSVPIATLVPLWLLGMLRRRPLPPKPDMQDREERWT